MSEFIRVKTTKKHKFLRLSLKYFEKLKESYFKMKINSKSAFWIFKIRKFP
jgi:hypothetical protein